MCSIVSKKVSIEEGIALEPMEGMADADVREDRDSLISNFASITGSDPDRSRLYLESAGWDLDLAIGSFFEEADEQEEEVNRVREGFAATDNPLLVPQPQRREEQPLRDSSRRAEPEASVMGDTPKSGGSGSASGSGRRGLGGSGFATLDSLRKKETEDKEEDRQAFYAGGSERSGQQVLGPGKKKDKNKDVVAEMFKAAKEHGGEVLENQDQAQSRPAVQAFKGRGNKLGTDAPDQHMQSDAIPLPSNEPLHEPSHEPREPVETCLKLWRNGFSVDEGPLRSYEDPANQGFLASIRVGEIPRELIAAARGGEVSLNMEDHRVEDYKEPPKKRAQPFVGEGFRLGNVAPENEASSSFAPISSDSKGDEEAAQRELKLDESQPTTSIQVRLADSTRLVIKLNSSHTVARIREFICRARPSYAARTFVLMTTFPNKELTEENVSIAEANLQNATVVQRMK